MVEKNIISIKKAKRLSRGQRIHVRRLKQAARKDPNSIVNPHK